jgi:hypothetical protein
MTRHLVPRRRTKEALAELLSVAMSEGTLTTLITRTAGHMVAIEKHIKAALSQAKVIHQDETGRSVVGTCVWLPVTFTRSVTHSQVHQSRGQQAMDAIGILANNVHGTSVHDAWAASSGPPQ